MTEHLSTAPKNHRLDGENIAIDDHNQPHVELIRRERGAEEVSTVANVAEASAASSPRPRAAGRGARNKYGAAAMAAIWSSGCLDAPTPREPEVEVAVVVLDASGSTSGRDHCLELVARAEVLVSGRSRRIELLGLATGGAASDYEPVSVGGWTSHRSAHVLFEGSEAPDSAKQELIKQVYRKCHVGWRHAELSAVYRAVGRASEALAARCVEHEREGRTCRRRQLFIHSDLRENIYVPLSVELRGRSARSRRRRPKADEIVPLKLDSIELSVCGVSETFGRDGREFDLQTVRTAWQKVFGATMPSAFAPSCPVGIRPDTNGPLDRKGTK